MIPIDDALLTPLAKLIRGENEWWARSGEELAAFFERAGVNNYGQAGAYDDNWLMGKLREYNGFSWNISKVLLRVAEPKEYHGDRQTTERVHECLNRILALEGFEIKLQGVTPILSECVPALVDSVISQEPLYRLPLLEALVSDRDAQKVLKQRRDEVLKCIAGGAHLAAAIMMGSLLEGVLRNRIQQNQKEANSAQCAPRDARGKPRDFCDWTFSQLLDVSHEVGWIQRDVHGFSSVLREYRNLVHPNLQPSSVTPDADTSKICWEVVLAALNDLADARCEDE